MAKNKATMWIAFYSILFLIGSGLFYGALTEFQKTKTLLQSGIKTTATVLKFTVSHRENGSMYKPVFEYTDRSSQKRIFESGIASKPPTYEIGEKFKLFIIRKKKKARKQFRSGAYIEVVLFYL
mgnify:FL=1